MVCCFVSSLFGFFFFLRVRFCFVIFYITFFVVVFFLALPFRCLFTVVLDVLPRTPHLSILLFSTLFFCWPHTWSKKKAWIEKEKDTWKEAGCKMSFF